MNTEFVLRILVAGMLGGVIGLEREMRAKEAGFRTHFLVALGSALFMVVSQFGFADSINPPGIRLDPSRIAAQVVSGIGFIGAGTIIFQKHGVRGLTTAAGLWVTSAIGLGCGAGLYVVAAATTLLVLISLEAFNWFLHRFGARHLSIVFSSPTTEAVKGVMEMLRKKDVDIETYNMQEKRTSNGDVYVVTIDLRVRRNKYEKRIIDFLGEFEGVTMESIE